MNPTAKFDRDGYPTEDTLKAIEGWSYLDAPGWFRFVNAAWNHHYGRQWSEKEEEGKLIRLATGGWSGNEDVIRAMRNNHVLWAMYWNSSHVGGLEVLKLPQPSTADATKPVPRAWQCTCGCQETYFDRTVTLHSDGTESGMVDRCARCGRGVDEAHEPPPMASPQKPAITPKPIKFYVAGCDQSEARVVACKLREANHRVTSRWLDVTDYGKVKLTDSQKAAIAMQDTDDVTSADRLVLVSSPYRVPGGKFVEAGIALAQGKPVYILGHRENVLLHHCLTRTFSTVEDLVEFLQQEA